MWGKRTATQCYNSDERFSRGCGAIPDLTVLVRPRAPHTAISLEHHAVIASRSNGFRVARDHLNETVLGYRRAVAELAVQVVSRGPHATILSQYHAVPGACSNRFHAVKHRLERRSVTIRWASSAQLTVHVPSSRQHTTILRVVYTPSCAGATTSLFIDTA